ncbi:uncharacterized protein I206_107459 [Kwoniella pini CBS 10737]|uniref:Uncharacterized protein n=1 Tax=Kwoniella pini CBS 10737 TaxID=1296096 RepID=A0A1B9HXD2_9TREE|nr:uncharacterized protein I206_05788 [Kwoniella pini CBS 10737]OCF47924.1 hypothetical protein I206_05788 [Kwoniella pini CBS 10737]
MSVTALGTASQFTRINTSRGESEWEPLPGCCPKVPIFLRKATIPIETNDTSLNDTRRRSSTGRSPSPSSTHYRLNKEERSIISKVQSTLSSRPFAKSEINIDSDENEESISPSDDTILTSLLSNDPNILSPGRFKTRTTIFKRRLKTESDNQNYDEDTKRDFLKASEIIGLVLKKNHNSMGRRPPEEKDYLKVDPKMTVHS